MFVPEIRHRFSARFQEIIVDDHRASGGNLVVKAVEGLDRGLVHIAVQSENGNFIYRGIGQRVLEPTLEEPHAVVEQAVALEVLLDLVA